jgi:DNA-binding LacI/PurR family transcriptional regulator
MWERYHKDGDDYMSVTIKDIAKIVGVSKSTVSRVLANSDKCSEETRQRVLEAMEKLNYKPNALARAMVTKKTGNIGLIIYQKHKPILSHPFYAPVVEAIVDTSMKRGYSLFIATDQDINASSAELLLEKRVDGIIFASFIDPSIILKYKNQGVPLVLLNNSVDIEGISYVTCDNYSGAYNAVNYLVQKGHKNIGFLCGPLQHRSYTERYKGYIAALKDNDIKVQDNLVRIGESTLSEGNRLMGQLLHNRRVPTAVFASNDMMAIGAIKAIKKEKLEIPNDIAVIGFDNIDFGNLIEPSLSTVHVNKVLMGELAVELLINEINKCTSGEKENILPTELVLREST